MGICYGDAAMTAHIINRGRGPELEGTRVTVYRVMDFLQEGSSPQRIAAELDLTEEQVQAALAYIDAHRAEVEAAYQAILARVCQPNPSSADAGRATTPEQLKQRIRARYSKLSAKHGLRLR
jgi:uncharacterized protein (DUF433 family)